MSFMYHTCVVALLEWLIHTPTSSTLVDIGLHPLWDLDSSFQQHNSFNIGRKLNDFTQVFARSIRVAHLSQTEILEDMSCGSSFLSSVAYFMLNASPSDESFWSGFSKLETFDLKVNPAARPHTADML